MDTIELKLSVPEGGVERRVQPFLAAKYPELEKMLGEVDISLNQPLDVTLRSKGEDVAIHLVIEEVAAGGVAAATFPNP